MQTNSKIDAPSRAPAHTTCNDGGGGQEGLGPITQVICAIELNLSSFSPPSSSSPQPGPSRLKTEGSPSSILKRNLSSKNRELEKTDHNARLLLGESQVRARESLGAQSLWEKFRPFCPSLHSFKEEQEGCFQELTKAKQQFFSSQRGRKAPAPELQKLFFEQIACCSERVWSALLDCNSDRNRSHQNRSDSSERFWCAFSAPSVPRAAQKIFICLDRISRLHTGHLNVAARQEFAPKQQTFLLRLQHQLGSFLPELFSSIILHLLLKVETACTALERSKNEDPCDEIHYLFTMISLLGSILGSTCIVPKEQKEIKEGGCQQPLSPLEALMHLRLYRFVAQKLVRIEELRQEAMQLALHPRKKQESQEIEATEPLEAEDSTPFKSSLEKSKALFTLHASSLTPRPTSLSGVHEVASRSALLPYQDLHLDCLDPLFDSLPRALMPQEVLSSLAPLLQAELDYCSRCAGASNSLSTLTLPIDGVRRHASCAFTFLALVLEKMRAFLTKRALSCELNQLLWHCSIAAREKFQHAERSSAPWLLHPIPELFSEVGYSYSDLLLQPYPLSPPPPSIERSVEKGSQERRSTRSSLELWKHEIGEHRKILCSLLKQPPGLCTPQQLLEAKLRVRGYFRVLLSTLAPLEEEDSQDELSTISSIDWQLTSMQQTVLHLRELLQEKELRELFYEASSPLSSALSSLSPCLAACYPHVTLMLQHDDAMASVESARFFQLLGASTEIKCTFFEATRSKKSEQSLLETYVSTLTSEESQGELNALGGRDLSQDTSRSSSRDFDRDLDLLSWEDRNGDSLSARVVNEAKGLKKTLTALPPRASTMDCVASPAFFDELCRGSDLLRQMVTSTSCSEERIKQRAATLLALLRALPLETLQEDQRIASRFKHALSSISSLQKARFYKEQEEFQEPQGSDSFSIALYHLERQAWQVPGSLTAPLLQVLERPRPEVIALYRTLLEAFFLAYNPSQEGAKRGVEALPLLLQGDLCRATGSEIELILALREAIASSQPPRADQERTTRFFTQLSLLREALASLPELQLAHFDLLQHLFKEPLFDRELIGIEETLEKIKSDLTCRFSIEEASQLLDPHLIYPKTGLSQSVTFEQLSHKERFPADSPARAQELYARFLIELTHEGESKQWAKKLIAEIKRVHTNAQSALGRFELFSQLLIERPYWAKLSLAPSFIGFVSALLTSKHSLPLVKSLIDLARTLAIKKAQDAFEPALDSGDGNYGSASNGQWIDGFLKPDLDLRSYVENYLLALCYLQLPQSSRKAAPIQEKGEPLTASWLLFLRTKSPSSPSLHQERVSILHLFLSSPISFQEQVHHYLNEVVQSHPHESSYPSFANDLFLRLKYLVVTYALSCNRGKILVTSLYEELPLKTTSLLLHELRERSARAKVPLPSFITLRELMKHGSRKLPFLCDLLHYDRTQAQIATKELLLQAIDGLYNGWCSWRFEQSPALHSAHIRFIKQIDPKLWEQWQMEKSWNIPLPEPHSRARTRPLREPSLIASFTSDPEDMLYMGRYVRGSTLDFTGGGNEDAEVLGSLLVDPKHKLLVLRDPRTFKPVARVLMTLLLGEHEHHVSPALVVHKIFPQRLRGFSRPAWYEAMLQALHACAQELGLTEIWSAETLSDAWPHEGSSTSRHVFPRQDLLKRAYLMPLAPSQDVSVEALRGVSEDSEWASVALIARCLEFVTPHDFPPGENVMYDDPSARSYRVEDLIPHRIEEERPLPRAFCLRRNFN